MRTPHSFSGTLASSVLTRQRVTGISVTWGNLRNTKKGWVGRVCEGEGVEAVVKMYHMREE